MTRPGSTRFVLASIAPPVMRGCSERSEEQPVLWRSRPDDADLKPSHERTPSGGRITGARGRKARFGECQAGILQRELHRLRTVVDIRPPAVRLLRDERVNLRSSLIDSTRNGASGEELGATEHPRERRLLWLFLPRAQKSTRSS